MCKLEALPSLLNYVLCVEEVDLLDQGSFWVAIITYKNYTL